jgi:hypothetical protein
MCAIVFGTFWDTVVIVFWNAISLNTLPNRVNPTKYKAVKGFGALFEFTDEKHG